MTHPVVTVVVPARNEFRDIGECLRAIAAQDYPRDRVEILVVDGNSTDGTAEAAQAVFEELDVNGRVLSNPLGTTPSSLNAGLAAAKGEILSRVDARSIVQTDHLSICVDVLTHRGDVTVVGGAQVAVARDDASATARGIARALRNPYTTGLSRYRTRRSSGEADTVYLGAFRTADLRAVGGWDQRFSTNQDFELNSRMRTRGPVWFDARLATTYRPRSGLRALISQHRRFGRWKAAGWLEQRMPLQPRQAVILAAPPLVAIAAVAGIRRGHVVTVAALGAASAFAVDVAGKEPGPLGDRALAMAAAGSIASGWWCGVAEQVLRFALGQRLLP